MQVDQGVDHKVYVFTNSVKRGIYSCYIDHMRIDLPACMHAPIGDYMTPRVLVYYSYSAAVSYIIHYL